jgi:CubicO group peptidase (beta-lactamase class C family)
MTRSALGAPWGGAHCSTEDVATFLHSFMHLAGKALREETARPMLRNHTECLGTKRGIGFALRPDGLEKGYSERSFGHSGSTGMLAWADPESDTFCVIPTSLPSSVSGVRSRRRKVGNTNSGAQSRAPRFDSHRFPSKWISSATFILALSEIPGADFPPIP